MSYKVALWKLFRKKVNYTITQHWNLTFDRQARFSRKAGRTLKKANGWLHVFSFFCLVMCRPARLLFDLLFVKALCFYCLWVLYITLYCTLFVYNKLFEVDGYRRKSSINAWWIWKSFECSLIYQNANWKDVS